MVIGSVNHPGGACATVPVTKWSRVCARPSTAAWAAHGAGTPQRETRAPPLRATGQSGTCKQANHPKAGQLFSSLPSSAAASLTPPAHQWEHPCIHQYKYTFTPGRWQVPTLLLQSLYVNSSIVGAVQGVLVADCCLTYSGTRVLRVEVRSAFPGHSTSRMAIALAPALSQGPSLLAQLPQEASKVG